MNIGKKLPGLTLAAALLLGGTRLHAQDPRNFWLLNNTEKQITEFYVSPHDSSQWGTDVLGIATLPASLGTVISFDRAYRGSCVMDFKLVFSDGTTQIYRQGRNVCLLNAVQFNAYDSIGLV